jgi:hypothetical protein
MNLGSMMDSVFYLGLIVTFVLIILLAYHFKQRIGILEEKNHTMFEILNNVVKELNLVRSSQMRHIDHQPQHDIAIDGGFSNNMSSYENPDTMEITSQLDYEGDSDDETEDSDDETEDSDDSGSDDDSSRVKLITVNDDLNNDDIPPVENFDTVSDYDKLPNVDEEDDVVVPEINNADSLIVEKLETSLEESIAQDPVDVYTDTDYSSHTLPQLKAMVISRGLASNPSKLKKSEVIALLEEDDKA